MRDSEPAYSLREKFYIRRISFLVDEGLTVTEIAEKLRLSKLNVRKYISIIDRYKEDHKTIRKWVK